MVGKAQWRKVVVKNKPIIVRVMQKAPEVKLSIRRTPEGFVAESPNWVLRSRPGQDFEEFFREVGGYVIGEILGE